MNNICSIWRKIEERDVGLHYMKEKNRLTQFRVEDYFTIDEILETELPLPYTFRDYFGHLLQFD